MKELDFFGTNLQLLPERAVYVESLSSLLVSDIHLGKSETFQRHGVPISNQVNQHTLTRLKHLCSKYSVEKLFILGDLFHSRFALVDEVLAIWADFLTGMDTKVQLIVGNHDRKLTKAFTEFSIPCSEEAIRIDRLILSHEPCPQPGHLNICGHVHPCVRIKTKLDNLRLSCFYLDSQNLLILPAFGDFTGGYEVPLKPNSIAYVIVDNAVIPFAL